MRVLQVLFLLAAAACGSLAVPTTYDQQQQQQQGSTQVQCDIYNDCIAAPLCVNGQIDVTGGGFIDLRTVIARVFCSSPDVCCRKPGVSPPQAYCPTNKACVSHTSCNIDGTYNTQGHGDSGKTKYYLPTCLLGEEVGVCCDTPIVESCPAGSFCSASGCSGQALNHNIQLIPYAPDYTTWARCPLPSDSYGICCQPDIPILDVCPEAGVCVPRAQCSGGEALDYSTRWAPYSPDYQFYSTCPDEVSSNICCKPKITHHDPCPDSSICVSRAQCDGPAYDHASIWKPYSQNYAYWSTCPFVDGTSGICCQPKPKFYDVCPDQALCLPEGQCSGDAYNFIGQWNPYSPDYLYWGTCASGVCCRPKIPDLKTCPPGSVCVPGGQCIGQSYDYLNNLTPYTEDYIYWSQCSTPLSSDGKGVCCQLPIADTCGVRNVPKAHPHALGTRIQSSKLPPNEAGFGEFPWQGLLFFSNYTFKCGAILITNRHVLTAAHCAHGFQPTDLRVRLGEWRVNTFDELLPYYDANIAKIVIHPDFNSHSAINDVAVVELDKPVPLDYHINIPCTADASYYKQFDGQRCIATGWGKDAFYGNYQHTLKKIELPMVPHDVCQSLLRNTRLTEYFILDKSFLCAGGEENEDACKGDGGGPLVCPAADGKFYLVGITAWGINCGHKDVPGVYVDVSQVYNFISDVRDGRPVKETYYPGQSQTPVDQHQPIPYSK